ncbi:MAG: cytosine permease [Phycisphaerales bacterium]|nr:cytosine permease [Phycisphaerales bacterium]
MANESLPAYLATAKPNPFSNRAPWYKNTAQTYAGIFLWIAFYDQLAGTVGGPGTLGMAGLGLALLALVAAGLISHFLFYFVPGMLGLKTGYPLYIVGTSTFGTKGGYFLPGIFMGLLQIGWYSVATYYATKLVLGGFGLGQYDNTLLGPPPPGGENAFSLVFVVLAVAWGYMFAFLGGMGIGMVAKLSTYFPVVPIVMLIIGGAMAAGHLGRYDREESVHNSLAAASVLQTAQDQAEQEAKAAGQSEQEVRRAGAIARQKMAEQPVDLDTLTATDVDKSNAMLTGALKMAGFLLMIQLVVGFFATAGACGADFCSNNRNVKDVRMGGLVGVALVTLFAGGLAVLAVAGAHGALAERLTTGEAKWGQLVNFQFSGALPVLSTGLGNVMLILFAIGSVAPACFCSFIIGNSLSTMLAKPQARVAITMAGATIGIVLAALGVAGNLAPFFGLIGASFGPVIGAMMADYVLCKGKWSGPRAGVNIPGYVAWIMGFIVGVSNNGFLFGAQPPVPGWFPTGVASLIVGFIVYWLLAKAGLESKTVPFAVAPSDAPATE